MSEKKQHVDIHRKLNLRKQLLEKAPLNPGAFYVPFIGDGDIAAELYSGNKIYGADIDAGRVKTAHEKLPDATIITADCDKYPFDVKDEFSVADFDSYSFPYAAFRTFWAKANKSNTMVLFFTDGEKQAINRTGHWRHPDGSKKTTKKITEKREIANKYYKNLIIPWFADYIKPYKIVSDSKYLRGMMLYWGVIIQNQVTKIKTVNEKSVIKRIDKFDSVKKNEYLELLRNGNGRTLAAATVGVHRQTVANHRLKDPEFAVEESHAEIQANNKIQNALFEAALSGNVTAIQVWLYNRDPGNWADKRKTELTGKNGEPIKYEHIHSLTDSELERIAAGSRARAIETPESQA